VFFQNNVYKNITQILIMKKKIFKKNSFQCPICNKTYFFSLENLFTHIEIFHNEISEMQKRDILNKFNIELLANKFKVNKKNFIKNKQNELEKFKKKVLKSLENSSINEIEIRTIKRKKSFYKLKAYLYRGLRKELRIYLDNANINYKVPIKKRIKKKKSKKKIKTEKEFFDKTLNSIRLIYTPMGNKR